jgi:putative endonuclease
VVLVHSERAAGRGAALRREAALKRLSRAEKLRIVESSEARARGRRARDPDRDPARA